MNSLFLFFGLAAVGIAVWYFLLRKQEINNNTPPATPSNIDTGNSDTTVDTNGSSGNNGEPGWSK